jgi:DNA-binding LytR/AlgR family response regulator
MRFRDALAQLDDMPGYRIHRSHWVAAPWLKRVRSEGRRYVAELNCGTELPVSRAYLDDLRRDGYLD